MGAAESTTREGFAPDHRVPVDFDDLNFYEILGISEDAPAEEVKRAYRQRVLQHHPDKNLDDPEGAHKRFKQVQDAFETLIDDDKRRHYDYTRQKSSAEIPSQTRECDPKNVPESFGHTKGDSPTESWYEWIFGQIPKSKFVYESYSSCNSPEPGISSRDIVEFLNSIGSFSWYGGSKDAFPIFRDFFACLAHDEWLLSRKHCPPFGCAHSPWTRAGWEGQELRDINVNTHGPEVREFYDFWMEFETSKNFEWIKIFDYSPEGLDSRNRRYFRKQSKIAQGRFRQEYNQIIRSIAQALRDEDPRYLLHVMLQIRRSQTQAQAPQTHQTQNQKKKDKKRRKKKRH